MNGQVNRCLRQGLGIQDLLSWWSWGVASWYMDIVINLEVLQTPYYWNFMEASSCKHDPFHFQPLSPFYTMGGEAENSKLLIRLHVSGDEPPSRSHPGTYPESLIRKKDAPSTLITWELQEPCVGNRRQRQIY